MSDIPEKVEQVARALAPLAWAALGTGDTLSHRNRRAASIRHARLVIEALREPTQAMIAAPAYSVVDGVGRLSDGDTANDVWRAMIDAALAEPARGGVTGTAETAQQAPGAPNGRE